jgi:hypothetical protein
LPILNPTTSHHASKNSYANGQASEFEQEFSVRLEEKAKLKAVNCKNIRFKIKTTPGGWTTSRKISAILQAQV